MVSIGCAKRHRLLVAALGGFSAVLLLGSAPVTPSGGPQSAPKAAPTTAKPKPASHQSLTSYERESLAVDRVANNIGERANRIAEAQRIYGLLQLILSLFGVGFTGAAAIFAWRATHWAKNAALETKRSADADNAALEATQAGLEEARVDAAKQEERFAAQLAVAHRQADAAVKSNQAYLSVISGSIELVRYGINSLSPPYPEFKLVLVVENIGKSPCPRGNIEVSASTIAAPPFAKHNSPYTFDCSGLSFINGIAAGTRKEIEIRVRPIGGPNQMEANYVQYNFNGDDVYSIFGGRGTLSFHNFLDGRDEISLFFSTASDVEENPFGRYPALIGAVYPLEIDAIYMGRARVQEQNDQQAT
ncbi:hypothetical protein [Caulobacter sp. BK020]|uniref:hypothetical protein n=1 Tax=Caulobacter sp. BK020 TaxID=2512117 RepID=UPI001043E9F6|nr:hypothetical protein [Caulobacter sp. BK020]TCS16612.1 hypothetical protein EV278_103118 [Caulobacter sp. BK020]